MNDETIPTTYGSWCHCITVKCSLALTTAYVAQRLVALRDERDAHTRELRRLYGEQHYQNLLTWFERAQREPGGA